jgi:hypothetical protein
MVALDSLYLTVPLVVAGLLVACAGRDLHHFVIKGTGFLVGFAVVLVGFAGPRIGATWAEGDLVASLGALAIGLGVAVVAGLITLSIAWGIYVLTVTLPGFVAGAFVGLTLVGPPENILHFGLLFVLGVVGATIAWLIHELLLVVWTAFLGALLVSIGLTGARLTGLPVLRRLELVLRDPIAVFVDTLAALDLFLPAIVVVFLLGLVVQWGLLSGESAEG